MTVRGSLLADVFQGAAVHCEHPSAYLVSGGSTYHRWFILLDFQCLSGFRGWV
jgi:hypothetical protein